MHMHDMAERTPLTPISCTVKEAWLENLHANINRLIMSGSRGKAAVTNRMGAKMDSDPHVPVGLLAWL